MHPVEYLESRAGELLTNTEFDLTVQLVRDYTVRKDLVRLLQGLKRILRTPDKHELLFPIRDLIAAHHVVSYDRFVSRLFGSNRKVRKLEITGDQSGDQMVIYIYRIDGKLGMSIRGGSEHGIGIYISAVERGSLADKCGLLVGDQILEANNINLENMPSSTAIKVLTSGKRLKLRIKRTGRVPKWKCSTETTIWYNINKRAHEAGEESDHDEYELAASMGIRDGLDRRIKLMNNKDDELGFNVRGGKEFDVGIYVSSVDPQSKAEENGIRIGDKIIEVNGMSFVDITHSEAVKFLQSYKHLILTVRDSGKYPVYKEVTAEFSWSSQTNLRTQESRSKEELYNSWLGPNIAVEEDYYTHQLDVDSLSTVKAGSLSSFTFSVDEPLSTIQEVHESSSPSAEQNGSLPRDIYTFDLENNSSDVTYETKTENQQSKNGLAEKVYQHDGRTIIKDNGEANRLEQLTEGFPATVTPQDTKGLKAGRGQHVEKKKGMTGDSKPTIDKAHSNGSLGMIFVEPTNSELRNSEKDINGDRPPHFNNCIEELKYYNKTYTTYPCEVLQTIEKNRQGRSNEPLDLTNTVCYGNRSFSNSSYEIDERPASHTSTPVSIDSGIALSDIKQTPERKCENNVRSSSLPLVFRSDVNIRVSRDQPFSHSSTLPTSTRQDSRTRGFVDQTDSMSVSSLSSFNESDFEYNQPVTGTRQKGGETRIANGQTDCVIQLDVNTKDAELLTKNASAQEMNNSEFETDRNKIEPIPNSSSTCPINDTPIYATVNRNQSQTVTRRSAPPSVSLHKFQEDSLKFEESNEITPRMELAANKFKASQILLPAEKRPSDSVHKTDTINDSNRGVQNNGNIFKASQILLPAEKRPSDSVHKTDTISDSNRGVQNNGNIYTSPINETHTSGNYAGEHSNIPTTVNEYGALSGNQTPTISGGRETNNIHVPAKQMTAAQKRLPINRRRRLSSSRPLGNSNNKGSKKKNKNKGVVLITMRPLADAC